MGCPHLSKISCIDCMNTCIYRLKDKFFKCASVLANVKCNLYWYKIHVFVADIHALMMLEVLLLLKSSLNSKSLVFLKVPVYIVSVETKISKVLFIFNLF